MTLITMYDSIDLNTFPDNPAAVAGYVGGHWPTESLLVKKFPKALNKSIAIAAFEDADILDIEQFDAVPTEAAAWVKRQHARGLKRPGLYASASVMPQVIANLNAAGIKRDEYVLWVAHYTFIEPIPPFEQEADAVQYTDKALGRNLDASICQETFFHPVVVVHNNPHYEWFGAGPYPSKWGNLNERQVVEHYDGARQHTLRYFLYLKKLRAQLQFLADRVAYEAIKAHPKPDGKPNWGANHWGWRYQNLVHRAQGQRFV